MNVGSKSRRLPAGIGLLFLLWAGSASFSRFSLARADPFGDEPHYYIMTVSLIGEHDLDLADNYARRDYRAFTRMQVTPHRTTFQGGTLYNHHQPGLPCLLVPFYMLAGRNGSVAFLNILAAIGAWLVYRWSVDLGLKRQAAWLASGAVGFTLPWIMIGQMAYPAVPTAVCLAASLWWLSAKKGPGYAVMACLLLCLLPWFHIKFALFSAAAYSFLAWRYRKCPGLIIWTALMALVSAVFFFLYQYRIYGDPLFLVKFLSSGFENPAAGITGMFLDRETGLWVYSPVFIMSAAGTLLLTRKDTPYLWMLGIVSGTVFISGAWSVWYSGHAPPARYLVPLLPMMGVLIALLLSRCSGPGMWLLTGLLLGLSWVHVGLVLASSPDRAIVVGNGTARLWQGFPDWIRFAAPSLINPSPGNGWTLAGWFAACSGLCLPALGYRHPGSRRRIRYWTAGMGFLVVSGLLAWNGAGRETVFRSELELTVLSDIGPVLVHPRPGAEFWNSMPDLEWEPVSGADGYKWFLRFPQGYEIGVETFGKTKVELPDSIVEAIPEGRYEWWVASLKQGRPGPRSPPRHFYLHTKTAPNR